MGLLSSLYGLQYGLPAVPSFLWDEQQPAPLTPAPQQPWGGGYNFMTGQGLPAPAVQAPPMRNVTPQRSQPQQSPLAALTAPQATPLFGPEHAMAPPRPPEGSSVGTKIPTPGEGTPPRVPWGQRISNWVESPLFQLGMSLLGNASNPDQYAGVGRDMRAWADQRMERQRQENEDRRLKAQENLQNTQFGWLREDRERADQRRERTSAWAATQGDFAQVDPEAAYEAAAQANALAGQPITPYQQATLDLQRRQIAASYARQNEPPYDERTERMLGAYTAMTGTLPVGMGRDRQAQRQIWAAAARFREESGLDNDTLALTSSAFRGNQRAISDLSTRFANMRQAEETALANLNLARELSGRVPRTSIPMINRALQEGRMHITGDPDTVAYYNALVTAGAEYMKVVTGNFSNMGLTDSARREALELLNAGMNQGQLDAAIRTATTEMRNRTNAMNDVMGGLQYAVRSGDVITFDQETPGGAAHPNNPYSPQQTFRPVTDAARRRLLANPTPREKQQFDEVFGPGAADRELAGRGAQQPQQQRRPLGQAPPPGTSQWNWRNGW